MSFYRRYPGVLRRRAWLPCTCGKKLADYSEANRYYTCCTPTTAADGSVVAIGQTWVGPPLPEDPLSSLGRGTLTDLGVAPAGMTTALYRRYDASDLLLYVGISDDLPVRSKWHERYSPWAPFVKRGSVEWFPFRAEAEAAETAAIKAEKPLFNKQHALPETKRAAVLYLLDEGRIGPVTQREASQK